MFKKYRKRLLYAELLGRGIFRFLPRRRPAPLLAKLAALHVGWAVARTGSAPGIFGPIFEDRTGGDEPEATQ